MEDKDMTNFQVWITETQKDIQDWTNWLSYHSRVKGKTWDGAVRWLKKNKPDNPTNFHASGSETFTAVLQAMFTDAQNDIYQKALRKKADIDD
ncbi:MULTISPECIES: hypothetical protein [Lactobacillus]|uniref:Uncharacterized protein n=1 Tax=Lactobacillus xujianguonis TaxID=2495899 RepID=A0A437SY08_9LACO|nr:MULTISPECIES: hypothetical protein [Lactobacillus]RVU71809.1 hypothetical protein EJK17_00610 [Lactobacillus xujianguonis]